MIYSTIYYVILVYFLLGGTGFYLINRKKDPAVARKSYIKFSTYFVIVNVLFFSIVINPTVFRYLALVIICCGFFEIIRVFRMNGNASKGILILSLFVFIVLSAGFYFFSGLEKGLILFSFLILSIFDSFSQISGQLWGRKKLFPKISPKKTLGGLIGGATIAILSSFVLNDLYNSSSLKSFALAVGIVFFAFVGDFAASSYKRTYNVKDFSDFIPGHGGFLDRFDSLIAGGAWVAVWALIINH